MSGRPFFPSANLRGYMFRGVFYILTIWPRGHAVAQLLKALCYRQVSIPDDVIGIFH